MQIIEQRSEQWFEQRKGKITSSEVHKIMGGKEGALTDTTKTYLLEKISEKLGGFIQLASGPALSWGTVLEDEAVRFYSDKTGLVVEKATFIPMGNYYGGSPDGLVQPNGVIEVKCPYITANHLKHGLIKTPEDFKKIAPNYYYQCVSNMMCADADWCDFISYDPRLEEPYKLFVFRLSPDPTEVNLVIEKLKVAVKYMQELEQKIEESATKDKVASI